MEEVVPGALKPLIPSARPEGTPDIPGYRIEKVLGRGTSGIVYRATQVSVDRLVALKVMHPDMLSNARSVKRLQREARIAAHLAHPNLIAAIDMGQSGGYWWFAMELVEGPSLAERMEKGGRLMEADALVLFTQLCDALQHASEKGVVHRDIKPANILLERPDFPRLADLGLARIEDDPMLTRTGATLGTPHYVSPEQARDPADADTRSDIWSLGATMFHAVCGQPPFSGTSAAEILSAVLYGPIPDPGELRPELSKGLTLVLRKCLSRDPNRRYFAPAELREDLQRVQAHKPPAIRRAALEPLDPSRRENRNVVAGTAAIVIALALAVLLLWRPWKSLPVNNAGPAQVDVSGPWPPLERFKKDLRGGQLSYATAFTMLDDLGQRVPASQRADWEVANANLNQELREALLNFLAITKANFEKLVAERDFNAAEALMGSALSARLVERTGFEPQLLPRDLKSLLESQRGRFERELRDERHAALIVATSKVKAYTRAQFLPAVERQLELGEWNAARLKLATELQILCAEAESDLRGLSEDELRAELASVVEEIDARLQKLNKDWQHLDGDVLVGEVRRFALLAEDKLKSGSLVGVLDTFESQFDALLVKHRLSRDELLAAPVHASHDLFVAQRGELSDLSDELAQKAANSRLEELDRETLTFYRSRNYESAVQFWTRHQDDALLAVVSEIVAVRLEEAHELVAFLQRAARGVEALDGTSVSLPGSITVSGKVETNGKPLERGFRIVTPGGNTLRYLLLPTTDAEGEVLGRDALELFAIHEADLAADIGLQLQRALFRFQERDYEGADELLRTEALQGGELILFDLGMRVAKQLGRVQDVQERRRAHAQTEVLRLTGSDAEVLEPKQRSVEIGRLLREYGDVLSESVAEVLRNTRASLDRVLPPSTLKEFEDAFHPEEATFPRFGRVKLSYLFDANSVGTWERGDWIFDGHSAWRGGPSADISELAKSRGPSLRLGDPFLVDNGTLELVLRLHQPKDSPPDLFAISAFGFHIAFAGGRAGAPARFLSDTTSLLDVARRVRNGDGVAFAGLTADSEHTILLNLSRGSGRLWAWVNGIKVEAAHHRPVKDALGGDEVSFRSIEPLDVLEFTISGNRR